MEGALTHSVNVVSVNLIMKNRCSECHQISKINGHRSSFATSSILGFRFWRIIPEKIWWEHIVVFANGGKRTTPIYIQRIEDQEGNILIDNSAVNPPQVMTENTAAMITYMLKSVVDKGTARGLRTRYGLKNQIAGKTGTSQSQADGWFIGATPDLVVGAWVGAEDQRVHFRSLAQGQGAATALPIVGNFLKQTYKDPEFSYMTKSRFPFPTKEIEEQLDCDAFYVPLSMSEFKEWWNLQKEKEAEEEN